MKTISIIKSKLKISILLILNQMLKSRVREIRTLGSVRGLPLSILGKG